jgi:hypothetical protein
MPPLFRGPKEPEEEPVTDVAEERAAFRAQLDRVEEEKQRALHEPGPTWREWWFHSASKWYILLGFLVVDLWVVAYWVEVGNGVAGLLSVLALLYGEFLLYQFLWFRPDPEVRLGRRAPFRPTWWRPVRYGRWTPEGEVARSRGGAAVEEEGPDVKEFL